MEIEEIVQRESYRDFDLVRLRHGIAKETRWHITQIESGMTRNYGFAASESAARIKVDDFVKQRLEGKDIRKPR
jgi:hypothetical protein